MAVPRRRSSDARIAAITTLVEARRKERGYTQDYLVKSLDVSIHNLRSAVLRYSTGQSNSAQILAGLGAVLGWPQEYLPGLIDGLYPLNADPADLPPGDTPAPAVRPVWKKVTTEQEFVVPDNPTPQYVRDNLITYIFALSTRVDDLTRMVADLQSQLNSETRYG